MPLRDRLEVLASSVTPTGRGGRGRPLPAPVDGLVVSGLTELALGALTGWPMALMVRRPDDLAEVGIRSGPRLRPWHLDLTTGPAVVARKRWRSGR